ncbi:hypothetical protein AGABI2DRAFT_202137 [Agaricus bisporus var. bisporus H97]|uniref:hypothetical protein n=1 Tax=Agaricus bisporus var. bisporus (strain H97 / ATCC MYA-4626 / FGSC 10389) TaxID=936046 RepID=UPI00029F5A16|nr:hypothetical protein AGABI2DRAFT_202137 [Agaricus bisporus var. bisporus H97]EKV47894.1 hypothetical protein AGABI2DRAFT_202137 [Agaricus bisporus var. bisporus H97]
MLRATFTRIPPYIRFQSLRKQRLPRHLSSSYTTTTTTSRLPDLGIRPTPLNAPQLALSDGQKQTIYALSTPPGRGGVAVIRVSGPEALEVWRKMVRPLKPKPRPLPWKLERCKIVNPEDPNEVLDDGLSVFFQAPKSFTTEPILELHTHSGRALLATLLGALSKLPFLRPAEPGEFTKRAFLNGRLDLTEVEGLADLIDAETEEQRKIASRGAWGEVRQVYDDLRTRIIHCLAQVEALIDFGEGEDLEEGVYDQAHQEAQVLLTQIKNHLTDNRRGEIIRSGIKLAIFGPPNSGKSSLLNFLAQREAAIVTSIPGTTRDVLQLTLDIGGMPVVVADTAGVRATKDEVEVIGIEKGIDTVKNADIAICVLSLADPTVTRRCTLGSVLKPRLQISIPESISQLAESQNTYFIFNKSDLVGTDADNISIEDIELPPSISNRSWILSLAEKRGTKVFLEEFGQELQRIYLSFSSQPNGSEGKEVRNAHTPIITRARHREHLEAACTFLQAFLDYSKDDIVLAAEELRYAARALGKVSGTIDVEDILDAVFRDFCIGK